MALAYASGIGSVQIITILLDAGAEGAVFAMHMAFTNDHEAAVKLLFERSSKHFFSGAEFVENQLRPSFCRRVVRQLLDTGAEPPSENITGGSRIQRAIVVHTLDGYAVFVASENYVAFCNCEPDKKPLGEGQLYENKPRALQGIFRLLAQVPAVRATSWLWFNCAAAAAGKCRIKPTATPVLRRTAAGSRVLLAALTRYSRKHDGPFLGGSGEDGST
ncbi:unnamed protein product [Laminaria digitata]